MLSVEIGVRAAGSEGERQGAEYIRDELASYGYVTAMQPFPFDTFVDHSTLDMVSPQVQTLAVAAMSSSIEGAVEADVAYAGLGAESDYPARIDGKIALVKRGVLFFSQKVANAFNAGAVAVVVYNNEPGIFGGQLSEQSAIPTASISREDGEMLRDLIENAANPQPVRLRLNLDQETVKSQSQNVTAYPPDHTCRIVVGAHYDSVSAGPGANDNASGTSVAIEIARALAADGGFDDVCFALFGAEEAGLLGSRWYVEQLTEPEKLIIEAMLNFDMLAVGDEWPLVGSDAIKDIAMEAAEKLGLDYSLMSALPDGAGSDHAPFIQAGIPAILFNCFCDEHYHTKDDSFEFLKEERLREAGALGMQVIGRILAG